MEDGVSAKLLSYKALPLDDQLAVQVQVRISAADIEVDRRDVLAAESRMFSWSTKAIPANRHEDSSIFRLRIHPDVTPIGSLVDPPTGVCQAKSSFVSDFLQM